MKHPDYIPLGSVVLLNGGTKKALVISRAISVRNKDKMFFFDYGAVTYPEGLTGNSMLYFNHADIAKILFKGCHDVEDEHMVDMIHAYLDSNPDLVRGSVETWEA